MYNMFYFVYYHNGIICKHQQTNQRTNLPTSRGGGGGEVGGYSIKLLPCHQVEMKFLVPEISSQFNASLP